MPFDFTKEILQITSFASRIAKKFNACIHLVAEHSSSEIHEDKTLNNQKIVKDHMENSGVDYKVVKLPGQASYEKEMLNYAGEINADIIAATYAENFMQMTNQHMKRIIENDFDIPVLTYSSEELSQAYY